MADPHILYVVSAVVALALVAFVIVVNVRAPELPYARKSPGTSLAPPPEAAAPAPPSHAPPSPPAAPPEAAAEPPARKSLLGEHLEIQDEDTAEHKKTES